MQDKKKRIAIFFDCNSSAVGGMSKGLNNFLEVVDYTLYNIDLYVLGERALFLDYVPESVDVKTLSVFKLTKIFNYFKKLGVFGFLMFIIRSLFIRLILSCSLHRIFGKIFSIDSNLVYWRMIRLFIFKFTINYDLAVAYSPDMFSLCFVIEKLQSSKKITFIHTDVRHMNDSRNEIQNLKRIFALLDYILCVSDSALESAAIVFPEYATKMVVVKNILSLKGINVLAHKAVKLNYGKDKINVATIARVSKQKGIDLAIDACQILRQKGYCLCWYVIGNIYCKDCMKMVEAKGISKDFVFVGAEFNPLPYIYQCDIYVQPSLTEGYCMALDEALILNKPVVVTDLPVFRSRLKDMETALFAELTPVSLAEKIELLIKDPKLRDRLSQNTKKLHLDTTSEINKFYAIING